MNDINIIYQYYIKESSQGQKPIYQILKIFDEDGEFSRKEMGMAFTSYGGELIDNKMSFKNEDNMQEFFIEWAQDNKVKQLQFFSQQDFNYLLQNTKSVREFNSEKIKYSKKWFNEEQQDKSLFKKILKN